MEPKLCKSLVIELRPKLQSANVFVCLEDDCFSSDSTSVVRLYENYFKIVLSDKKSFVGQFDHFRAEPSTLSSIRISKRFISFRFFTRASTFGSFKTELLENNIADFRATNCSLVKKDVAYAIQCVNCSRSLITTSNIKFQRVLPLPESLDSSDWFCHGHDSKSNLEPTIKDLFFSNCFSHIHTKNLCNFLVKNKVIACKFCFNWLGIVCGCDIVKVWFNTVKFIDNKYGAIQTSGLSDIFLTIKKLFENSLFNSLKTVLQCRHSNGTTDTLLIWILEKQLRVVFGDQETWKEMDVAKTLFRFFDDDDNEFVKQWTNDRNVEIIDVSKAMMTDVLKHLYKNNKVFSTEFAKSNDFFVSYLFMYE